MHSHLLRYSPPRHFQHGIIPAACAPLLWKDNLGSLNSFLARLSWMRCWRWGFHAQGEWMMKQILIRVGSRYTQQPPHHLSCSSSNTMTGNSYEDLWVCFKPPHLPASVQAQTFLSEAFPASLSLSLEDSVQPGEGSKLGLPKPLGLFDASLSNSLPGLPSVWGKLISKSSTKRKSPGMQNYCHSYLADLEERFV